MPGRKKRGALKKRRDRKKKKGVRSHGGKIHHGIGRHTTGFQARLGHDRNAFHHQAKRRKERKNKRDARRETARDRREARAEARADRRHARATHRKFRINATGGGTALSASGAAIGPEAARAEVEAADGAVVYSAESSFTVTVKVDPKIMSMYDSTGDGVPDSGAVDTDGDGKANASGKIVDTSGDGVGDAVQVDTTGDGLLDTLVFFADDDDSAVQVTATSIDALVVTCTPKEALTFEALVDALETWGEAMVIGQAASLDGCDGDFVVKTVAIGADRATRTVDADGKPGSWDQELDVVELLESVGYTLTVESTSTVVTVPAAAEKKGSGPCCVVM